MVKWTRHAKRQLRHIHDYIAQDSPIYAKRVSAALVEKTIGLDELPRKGHIVPELNEDAVRELASTCAIGNPKRVPRLFCDTDPRPRTWPTAASDGSKVIASNRGHGFHVLFSQFTRRDDRQRCHDDQGLFCPVFPYI